MSAIVIVLVHKKVICKAPATGIECPGAKLPFRASKIGSAFPLLHKAALRIGAAFFLN